jgi:hypothetical protein
MGYLSRRAFCNGVTPKTAARYKNTPFTLDYLCAGKGSFLLPDHDAWKLWGRLPDLLTTRKRPVFSQPFFTDRNRTKRLLQSLDRDARRIAPYLIARMPLSRSRTLLDVGGGLGTFALACCRRFPQLRATIVKHPRVVPITHHAVKNAKMAKRGQVIGLDIVKDPLPAVFVLAHFSQVGLIFEFF